MPRTVIAVVVAAVIAALTAIAIFVTSASFDERVKKDADGQIKRAYQVVQKLDQLEGIDIANKVERLAADPGFVAALKADAGVERNSQASLAFQRFNAKDNGDAKADILALVDASGNLIAMSGVSNPVAKQWKNDKGDLILAPLTVVLGKRVIISDIWDYQDKGMMKVGVASVVDPDAPGAKDADSAIIGAVVVAYAQTAHEAQRTHALLGTEIAYYDNGRVIATSFTRGAGSEEDTSKAKLLTEIIKSGKVTGESAALQRVNVDGTDYFAAAVSMPRSASKALPANYPAMTAGAMLLSPIADSSGTSGTVKLFIGLVGIGALALAMLGLYLLYRRLMSQVDQIELGVADIINGNIDRTFRPVGIELDGLANGLNVMLARLFGRPEPGDEELDDDGNPLPSSGMQFEDGADDARAQAADPDLAALAQEAEPDYYKRVWTEYLAARTAIGTPDDVTFENFIAKLKVNEGKLKAQHQCRAVRFRVVTKDGKVSLKPVPIFA